MKIITELPPLKELGFGKLFAPQMVLAKYQNGAWGDWKLTSVDDFHLPPTAKVLHYAQEIFEGMKAFRGADNRIGLFRPRENIRRMARSAEIMAMPAVPESLFWDSLKTLVQENQSLVPNQPGALYLRPTLIATDSTLGVAPSLGYDFFILASPVGGYFGDTTAAVPAQVKIWVTNTFVRACPGGLGAAKAGANYAASLQAVRQAKKLGFDNVLFLDALQHRYLEELSGMNIFVVHKGTLKTPALKDTILPGITRASLMAMARADGIETVECDLDIETVLRDIQRGDITEMFACGTGASVTSIAELGWNDQRIEIAQKKVGPISTRLYSQLLDIQAGRRPGLAADWMEYI